MSYAVVFSTEAERDLAAVVDYIGQDNPRRARTFTDEFQSFVTEKLSTFPASGPEIGSRRYVVFGNHLILYRMDETTSIVLVQVIVEGHRNWRKAYGSLA